MNRTKVLCYVVLVAGAGAAAVQLAPHWLASQASRPLDRGLATALETAQAVGFGGVAALALIGVVVALLVKNDQRTASSREPVPAAERAAPPAEPTGAAPLSAADLGNLPRRAPSPEPAFAFEAPSPAPAAPPPPEAAIPSPSRTAPEAAPATPTPPLAAPLTAPEPFAAPVASPSTVPDDEGHWKAIYADFQRTRADCGEPAAPPYERFREKLQKNREQLVERFRCRSVRFQVYVKDGKAALKASPVR